MTENKHRLLSPLFVVIYTILFILFIGCSQAVPDDMQKSPDKNPPAEQKDISDGQDGLLKIHFLDVGQADSILVRAPSGKNMLIDAGNNDDDTFVTSYLQDLGVETLDIVVGTHPHEDHIGGLDTVIDTFPIGRLVMPAKTHTTNTYRDVLDAVQHKGLTITEAKPGVDLDLGPGMEVTLLAPISTDYESMNNYSAVIRLVYGGTSFLFTGDAEEISEKEMLAVGTNLCSNVLKVGHHGSSTSSNQEFLEAVRPDYAIIMCGRDNDYGHPHQETLDKLKGMDVAMLRTDEKGTITAVSDGVEITFQTEPAGEKQNITVYKTENGSKYHQNGCRYLNQTEGGVSLQAAKKEGLKPCAVCNPPQ